MSLTRIVASLVERHGAASLEDLAPILARDGYSRKQVRDAMKNAQHLRLIHCEGRIMPQPGSRGAGSPAAPYYPGPKPAAPMRVDVPRGINSRPPASVWEIAHGRHFAGEWPPRFDQSRAFNLLGSWDAPDAP